MKTDLQKIRVADFLDSLGWKLLAILLWSAIPIGEGRGNPLSLHFTGFVSKLVQGEALQNGDSSYVDLSLGLEGPLKGKMIGYEEGGRGSEGSVHGSKIVEILEAEDLPITLLITVPEQGLAFLYEVSNVKYLSPQTLRFYVSPEQGFNFNPKNSTSNLNTDLASLTSLVAGGGSVGVHILQEAPPSRAMPQVSSSSGGPLLLWFPSGGTMTLTDVGPQQYGWTISFNKPPSQALSFSSLASGGGGEPAFIDLPSYLLELGEKENNQTWVSNGDFNMFWNAENNKPKDVSVTEDTMMPSPDYIINKKVYTLTVVKTFLKASLNKNGILSFQAQSLEGLDEKVIHQSGMPQNAGDSVTFSGPTFLLMGVPFLQ